MNGGPESGGDVTVVIPVRDRAALLRQTLRSVLAQSQAPREVVVVDDGSTDGSGDVARELDADVVRTGGVGPAAARNAGLERVRTEFVSMLDSDDLLRPRALVALAEALDGAPRAPLAFGCALEAVRERGRWAPAGLIGPFDHELRDLRCSLYARNFIPTPAVLLRTAALREAGGYPTWLTFNEDHYTWVRMCCEAEPVHVAEVLAVTRRHAGSRHHALDHAAVAAITSLADSCPGLERCRPERLGVQLCNMSVAAVRSRRPRELARLAGELVLAQRRRGRIVRAAAGRLRTRRAGARRGIELWQSDPSLREFLAAYE